MTKYLWLIILAVIVIVGCWIRFYKLDAVPPPLSHDETAIGYNAYSVLKTGKDEYGVSYPLLFKSFNDYKLPGMVYSVAASVAVFGLNAFGVRFPSAFYGNLAVIVFFLILKEFLYQNANSNDEKIKLYGSVLTTFFTLSIWHINFSRQCFESNGAVFFLMLGTYFLLRFIRKPESLIFTSISYALSVYFYYSVRLVIPFILLAFLFGYKSELLRNVKTVLISVLVGIAVLAPLIPSMLSVGGLERIKTVSVYSDNSYIIRQDRYAKIIAANDTITNRIIYNRRIALIQTVIENYLKNVSYGHLFINGAGRTGLQYPFELPLILAGIYMVSVSKSKAKWIMIAWLLSWPLSGAFSNNQPNALRTLPGAPILSLLSGLGCLTIFNLVRSGKFRIAYALVLLAAITFSLTRFYISYFQKFPYDNPLAFGDGERQMVEYVSDNENKYDRIIITGYYWRPYIFMLFWQKYDPAKYQSGGAPDKFGKYIFGRAQWDKEGLWLSDAQIDLRSLTDNPEKTLFVLSPADYDIHRQELSEVNIINGLYAKNVFIAARLRE